MENQRETEVNVLNHRHRHVIMTGVVIALVLRHRPVNDKCVNDELKRESVYEILCLLVKSRA